MIGVTVGVGAYLSLAWQAAESMARHTGLECIVLTDEHFVRAGLSGQPAHLLKLFIWDFVDVDEILWFDADTRCLHPWNPSAFSDENALVATRDWIWRECVQEEARQIHLPREEYFLASLMFLNRRKHEPMLRLARGIYPQLKTKVFEQTALNAARAQLEIPIRFLDRRFNWSLFGEGNLHRGSDVVVAHFNDPSLRQNPEQVAEHFPEAEGVIDASAFSRMGNRFYRYMRLGYDERPIYFRDDGTIGSGGGTAERFWFVRKTESGPVLVIGSETTVTCELVLGENDTWRGNWLDHEKMPVLLTAHHGQMLLDRLSELSGPLRGAEIGVFRGDNAALLLQALPQLTLWMVDTWRCPVPGERFWEDPHMGRIQPEQMAEALAQSLSSTEFARERRVVVIDELAAAAACVFDRSLDFVFLDADHSYESTYEALRTWAAKVRTGGIIAGHDLDYPDYPGVRKAVERYCGEHVISWHSAPDYVWWFVQPAEHSKDLDEADRDILAIDRSAFQAASLLESSTCNGFSNRYFRYLRVGHEERPLFFHSDGSIGAGGGRAERFWSMDDSPHGKLLTIRSDSAITCQLRAVASDRWEGSWLDYERMPILVSPHRGQVILDLLMDRSRSWRGAEIGVFEGHTSALLLQALPHLRLWMVDAWNSPKEKDQLWEDPYMRQVSSSQMLTALNSSIARSDFARERRTIVIADLVLAAACVPDQSLDFVFLDADHSKAGTLDAMRAWFPKVVAGGIVAGHDLDHPDFPGVREAVEEFTGSERLPWQAGADFVWWFRVPRESKAPGILVPAQGSQRLAVELTGR